MTAEKIILKYQEKGVKLFLNEDKLQFSGPKGIIDDDARKELQAYKDDIITYLKSHKGQVVCDKTQRFLPFEMTDIQVAYVIGRNRTYQYGGIGCKIYAEYEFPKLDLEKLERAWENVVKNNDMLHAVIKNNKEQQILQDYEVPAIEKWKIEDISPDERKNKLNEIRDRLVMKQYKVGEWPLFDLEISELEDVTILHISLDMLIADFLSINIIVDELEDNYFGDKKKTFTKELSFRDVIVYEHNRQKHPQYSETMKKDKQYWEERISTMPEAPDLPVKEDLKDTSIRQLNTYIEKERYLELQKLADDNNITLSGLILACYAEVLAYWSNSKRFSINVTMANREQVHPDIYSIIGDFTKINILEICQDYNLSFIQRVQFIQKQLWNDMEHMSYSGIEVLREMTRLKKKEVIIPYVFTNTFYPQLSNVKQFIFLAGKLREKNDVQYINAECSVHVLFPLIDILGRAIGGLRPWKFERVEETYKNSPFCIIYGSIYNIPICINVQNQMDPSDPENSVLLFHKISLYTECGNLTMIGTNSDIMWEPRIRKCIAADGGFHLEADDEYLDLPVYEEMHNDEGKCFREMFSDTWPDSIKLFLEDFYRDFYLGKKMDSNAQFLISVCQAWKDLGSSIGSANIIHAYTTKPIKISEIVK